MRIKTESSDSLINSYSNQKNHKEREKIYRDTLIDLNLIILVTMRKPHSSWTKLETLNKEAKVEETCKYSNLALYLVALMEY